jgi:hypothetical protein
MEIIDNPFVQLNLAFPPDNVMVRRNDSFLQRLLPHLQPGEEKDETRKRSTTSRRASRHYLQWSPSSQPVGQCKSGQDLAVAGLTQPWITKLDLITSSVPKGTHGVLQEGRMALSTPTANHVDVMPNSEDVPPGDVIPA